MSEKTFYDFKGEPIGVKEFIELYEPYYFIENERTKESDIHRLRDMSRKKLWLY